MDIYDNSLQQAVEAGNPVAITESIENGLQSCTHMMCIVSEKTVTSWWVPYEIGYGKRSKKLISTLTLKDTVTIPPYLEITKLIRGTLSLNSYLKDLGSKTHFSKSISEHIEYNSHSKMNHPLDAYLDWNR